MSNSGEGVGRGGGVTDFHPIAKVSVGQILGLVEAIDEVGGVADVATISQEVDMELDRLGPILSALFRERQHVARLISYANTRFRYLGLSR